MGLLPIGLHARVLLNRLRNELVIAEAKAQAANEGDREKCNEKEQQVRSELERVDRLNRLRSDV